MLDMCTLNQYRYVSHEIRFIMLIVVVLGSTYLYLIGLLSMALCLFERNSFYRYRFTIHNRGTAQSSPVHCVHIGELRQ